MSARKIMISEVALLLLSEADQDGVTPIDLADRAQPLAQNIDHRSVRSLYAGMSSMMTHSRALIESCQGIWRGKNVRYRATDKGRAHAHNVREMIASGTICV